METLQVFKVSEWVSGRVSSQGLRAGRMKIRLERDSIKKILHVPHKVSEDICHLLLIENLNLLQQLWYIDILNVECNSEILSASVRCLKSMHETFVGTHKYMSLILIVTASPIEQWYMQHVQSIVTISLCNRIMFLEHHLFPTNGSFDLINTFICNFIMVSKNYCILNNQFTSWRKI